MALSEVELLLADEVRDIRTYLTVLTAIGEGAHALKNIADATLTAPTNLTKYLGLLQEFRLVERRVPATVPLAIQHRSRQGRYHLTDPFHRFYFRLLQPNQAEIAYQPDRMQLIEQTIPKTIASLPNAGTGWRVLPALFSRSGATEAAKELLNVHGGLLVDLPMLYDDLGEL